MQLFIADLLDETSCAFVAETMATNREEARQYFWENYPESRLVSVMTEAEIEAERDLYYDRAAYDMDLY